MQIAALLLLATTTFSLPVDRLVLVSGERIAVAGGIRVEDDRLLFNAANGSLYSISSDEVDFEATEALARQKRTPGTGTTPNRHRPPDLEESFSKPLAVSEEQRKRLLAEMEANHEGIPAPVQAWEQEAPPAGGATIEVTEKDDEWYWKDRARSLEEGVQRAKENLALLIQEEQDLEDQILGFLSLGYKPDQFSYQVLRLQVTRDSIRRARLDVTRAERALARFRDDARRQGILPGWLR